MSIARFGTATSQLPSPTAYCVDMGGSFIKFGVAFGPGDVDLREKVPTPIDSWPDLIAAMAALIKRWGSSDDAGLPLAISTTGLFNVRTGTVTAANIPCLSGHDVVSELSAYLGRPVLIANDADCFALAEANVGLGRGHDVVFCAIMGTGIGGGLVAGGRLVRGAAGVTGEWGHGPIVRTEVTLPGLTDPVRVPRFPCGCGQVGCTDTIGGARGIERLHHHLHGARATSHEILDAWELGDAAAVRTVAVFLELLSEPLAFAVNITGASIVPVGGGLASRTALIAALDQHVREHTLIRFAEPLVVPGTQVADGGLVGMSVLVEQK